MTPSINRSTCPRSWRKTACRWRTVGPAPGWSRTQRRENWPPFYARNLLRVSSLSTINSLKGKKGMYRISRKKNLCSKSFKVDFLILLEVKLLYELVCPPVASVGRSVCLSVSHNFLKEREVSLPFIY